MDQTKAERVLAMVAAGRTLTAAARAVGVDRDTIYRWRAENEGFAVGLREARRGGAEAVLDMAQDAIVEALEQPAQVDGTAPPRPLRDARLMRAGTDGALRLAAKLDPERYGDKLSLAVIPLPLGAVLIAADARARELAAERAPRVIEGESARLPADLE